MQHTSGPRSQRRPDRLLERPRRPALDRPAGGAGRLAGAGLRTPDRPRQGRRPASGSSMSAAAAAPPPSRWRSRSGPTGHVLGIDISAPMLARARQVAPTGLPVEFVLADATVYPFEPASFDLLASRFGVMFFAEPALVLRQYAPGAAAVGTAGVRLLARAARKSVDDGAAAGGLPARAETAAAGA